MAPCGIFFLFEIRNNLHHFRLNFDMDLLENHFIFSTIFKDRLRKFLYIFIFEMEAFVVAPFNGLFLVKFQYIFRPKLFSIFLFGGMFLATKSFKFLDQILNFNVVSSNFLFRFLLDIFVHIFLYY